MTTDSRQGAVGMGHEPTPDTREPTHEPPWRAIVLWPVYGAACLWALILVVGLASTFISAYRDGHSPPPEQRVSWTLHDLQSYLPLRLPASARMLDAYVVPCAIPWDNWAEYYVRVQIAAQDLADFTRQPKLPCKWSPNGDGPASSRLLRRIWPGYEDLKPEECRSWKGQISRRTNDRHYDWQTHIVVGRTGPDTATVYIWMASD